MANHLDNTHYEYYPISSHHSSNSKHDNCIQILSCCTSSFATFLGSMRSRYHHGPDGKDLPLD